MTALLTDNLPLLAGAPNGIKKLRELILAQAVRGKLLAQNSDDEPASQLLKRIAKEKAQLEAAGQIRKQKPLSQITEEEQPFELPAGWAWARLADIAFSQAGFAFKSNGFNQAGLGLPLIRIRDVGQAFSGTYYEGDYRSEFLVQRGDYLISMDGEFRVAAWEGEASLLNQRVSRLVFFGAEVARRFIADSLQARLLELQGVKAYTTVDHLSGGQISESVIALPPLEEQHRIVAKVDELMALCDRLEAQQADAESTHAQLVQALLDSLIQASDATDFAANWQRLVAHFHTLFTTEPSIDALKQTLLQLAVMGKLVPQEPSDEPASELMTRLRQERSEWLLDKQDSAPECKTMLRKLSSLSESSPPFSLPASWQAVHLIDCSRMLVDCHNKTAPYVNEGIPIIRTSNIRNREFRFDDLKYINEETYEYWSRRCPPEPGDIMFTREAPMGEAAVIPDGARFCLGQRTMLVRPMHDYIDNRYLLIALTEPHLLERASTSAIGSTVKHLRVGDVEQLNIPLPPLAEQHRIVTKVDQLMALCEQLKTRLTQTRQLNEQLASTLVEQAVA